MARSLPGVSVRTVCAGGDGLSALYSVCLAARAKAVSSNLSVNAQATWMLTRQHGTYPIGQFTFLLVQTLHIGPNTLDQESSQILVPMLFYSK